MKRNDCGCTLNCDLHRSTTDLMAALITAQAAAAACEAERREVLIIMECLADDCAQLVGDVEVLGSTRDALDEAHTAIEGLARENAALRAELHMPLSGVQR